MTDRKITYRVITFDATTTADLENQINTFLREEADVTAVSLSHIIKPANEAEKVTVIYSALLMYSFPD